MFQSRMNISAKSSPSPLRLRGVSRTFARKRIRVPPPFISNKAASLIVAPDKMVFVGDRNPFTPTQIDRKRFPFARPVHRETTLPLLSRPTTRKPISPPWNRAYLLSIRIKSNADRFNRIRTFNSVSLYHWKQYVVGQLTWDIFEGIDSGSKCK